MLAISLEQSLKLKFHKSLKAYVHNIMGCKSQLVASEYKNMKVAAQGQPRIHENHYCSSSPQPRCQ